MSTNKIINQIRIRNQLNVEFPGNSYHTDISVIHAINCVNPTNFNIYTQLVA